MTVARGGDAKTRRRGRPQVTSREEIARVALDVARLEGLEGVTVRRIADELGHAPMTVYRITATKADVHELMVETVLRDLRFEIQSGISWRDQLIDALGGLYRSLRQNPAIIELMAGPHPIFGPRLDALRESLLEVVSNGIGSRQRAMDVTSLLAAFVVGAATAEVAKSRRSAELEEHLRTANDSTRMWLQPLSALTIDEAIRALVEDLTTDRFRSR